MKFKHKIHLYSIQIITITFKQEPLNYCQATEFDKLCSNDLLQKGGGFLRKFIQKE
jgi:hypothetical protein